jgi:quinol monooxygenase YgiN
MAVRHVIAIQVAAGKEADFVNAFKALQAVVQQEEGCEQYELFQNVEAPDRMVMLERWTSQELLEKHMESERTGDTSLVDALVDCWAPGTTPTLERFEV